MSDKPITVLKNCLDDVEHRARLLKTALAATPDDKITNEEKADFWRQLDKLEQHTEHMRMLFCSNFKVVERVGRG